MRTYTFDIDSYIGYPITKGWVAAQLRRTEGKPCTVRVNSYGGDLQTALDIRQQFIDHGHVTVYVYGMTASAATILAMGAEKICMSRYALMLIHGCSQYVEKWGNLNAGELEEAVRDLSRTQGDLVRTDSVMAALYAARTGETAEKMAAVMAEGRWLTADECVSLGLCDCLLEEEEETSAPQPLTAHDRNQITACGLPMPPAQDTPAPAASQKEGDAGILRLLAQYLGLTKKPLKMETDKQEQNAPQEPENAISGEAQKKIEALEAENRSLRGQIAALSKADGEQTPSAPAEGGDGGAEERPTAFSMLGAVRHAL